MILKWPKSMRIEPLKCAWDLWLDVWSIFTDGLCVLGYNVLYMFLRTSLLSMLHKSSACSLLSGLLHPSITKKDVLKSSEVRFVNIFSLFWRIVPYIFWHFIIKCRQKLCMWLPGELNRLSPCNAFCFLSRTHAAVSSFFRYLPDKSIHALSNSLCLYVLCLLLVNDI